MQKSSLFKNLFDQLELIANKRRMATEALVSIVLEAGMECLIVEAWTDAFLQDTNEITFSNKDMGVEYPDHRRPLFLAASINQVLVKRALVDTSVLVNLIPLNTLQVARILENKIQEYPMEVMGFGEKGEYTAGYI